VQRARQTIGSEEEPRLSGRADIAFVGTHPFACDPISFDPRRKTLFRDQTLKADKSGNARGMAAKPGHDIAI
jgi:hypothetical protein